MNKLRPRIHYLAIRHNPSGGFLPQMTSYGFTRCAPSLVDPPRLFTKIGAAKQALDRWLQGEWFEGFYDDERGLQDIRIQPVAGRRREDMEIVEIEITARTFNEALLRNL